MQVITDIKDLVGKTISYFDFEGYSNSTLTIITEDAGIFVADIRQETNERDEYNGDIYLDPWSEEMIMDHITGYFASSLFLNLLLTYSVITELEYCCFVKEREFNKEQELEKRMEENKKKEYEEYLRLRKKFEENDKAKVCTCLRGDLEEIYVKGLKSMGVKVDG